MTGTPDRQRAMIAMTAVLAFSPLGVFADAGREHGLRVAIDYATDDALDESQVFVYLTDASPDVQLRDMQPGGSRSIRSAKGRPAQLNRVADGLERNTDGRVVQLPEASGKPRLTEVAQHDAALVDKDVMQAVQIVHTDAAAMVEDAIVIVNPDRIDTVIRDGVRASPSSAGHTADDTFLGAKTRGDRPQGSTEQPVITLTEPGN